MQHLRFAFRFAGLPKSDTLLPTLFAILLINRPLKNATNKPAIDFHPIVTEVELANHFDYVKKLIGGNHIGIGGDYDEIADTIKGMEDIASYPKLLIQLLRRGWTESEIKKLQAKIFYAFFLKLKKKYRKVIDHKQTRRPRMGNAKASIVQKLLVVDLKRK